MTYDLTVRSAQDHELFSALADKLVYQAKQGQHRIRDAAALKQFEERVRALMQ